MISFFINNFNMQNLMFVMLLIVKKNTFPNNSVFFILFWCIPKIKHSHFKTLNKKHP